MVNFDLNFRVVVVYFEVEVRIDTSFAGFTENQIQLIKDGTLQGSNKSTSASISTSWTTMTYGGSTDKWGWTSISLSDVQDSGFEVLVFGALTIQEHFEPHVFLA